MKRFLRSEIWVAVAALIYVGFKPYFDDKLLIMALIASSYSVARSIFKHGRGQIYTGWLTTELYVIFGTLIYIAIQWFERPELARDAAWAILIGVVAYEISRGVSKKVINNVFYRL